ncbi:helix-turn-helix domain-containing protein [Beijerinckia sp. L45]|uniref:helix-turn-helix domain-containing protein n=1 Tax=Beijerinckia sp. L45 TaxID=1641855 RepID=UPI00131CECD3|nr:helix-turn-helix domain-containing protein [Beijerinckia sp. L45]
MNDLTQPLLTPKQAAHLLNVSQDTLRAFVRLGELRYIHVGTGKIRVRMMFEHADLVRFVDSRKQTMVPPTPYKVPTRVRAVQSGLDPRGFRARQAASPTGKLSR